MNQRVITEKARKRAGIANGLTCHHEGSAQSICLCVIAEKARKRAGAAKWIYYESTCHPERSTAPKTTHIQNGYPCGA